MGAKNHGVIMPDANKEYTVNQLVGAAFGAAGQRCMALTTAIMVGDAKEWINEVADKASKLKVTAGHEPSADLGPVISPASKARIQRLVKSATDEGAKVILDGTDLKVRRTIMSCQQNSRYYFVKKYSKFKITLISER